MLFFVKHFTEANIFGFWSCLSINIEISTWRKGTLLATLKKRPETDKEQTMELHRGWYLLFCPSLIRSVMFLSCAMFCSALPAFYPTVFTHVPVVNSSFCPFMFPLSAVRSSTSGPQSCICSSCFISIPAFVPCAYPVCSQLSFLILFPSLLFLLLVLGSFCSLDY